MPSQTFQVNIQEHFISTSMVSGHFSIHSCSRGQFQIPNMLRASMKLTYAICDRRGNLPFYEVNSKGGAGWKVKLVFTFTPSIQLGIRCQTANGSRIPSSYEFYHILDGIVGEGRYYFSEEVLLVKRKKVEMVFFCSGHLFF